jgi:glycosyltransferase involved in cell wall biosynthesis
MKILQIVPHYWPAIGFGGALRVAHGLSRALVRAHHEVTVCTTNQLDHVHNLDVPVDAPVDVDGVTVYYEPVSVFRYWGFSPALWRRTAKEIERADVVLIHAHYQFANWAGAYLARRARKPYVIFAHGSLTYNTISSSKGQLKRIYLRLLEHGNFNGALFIVFNAPEEKKSSLYGEQGKIILNGIDPQEFEPMPPAGYFREKYPQLKDTLFFLFLGRLDVMQKGLDLLIPAFARLQQTTPHVHLVLAGPDENKGAALIRSLAQQYGISDSVTLPGLIDGQDKCAALQDADVFVLPSRFEGLSIALLEAMFVGLPILTTNRVGLSKEIEQQQAGLAVSPEIDAIYQGLCQLADPQIRLPMRQRAKALLLEKYTWDAIAEDLIQHIQQGLA